ncbi:hypothetical protein CK203_039848 [Vitis vinifera]|uniref:Uncharacterized protein n=1 Tax=Vitis vinifera TaxID=29760 RepID=A0A438HQH9_VITVI|nr:hypothetical protein CK203_039848 [Vitis vinifera]
MSCMRLSATMRRFSEVIDELHLKDLPLFDGKQFNGLVQKIMANPVFDHTPIMLDGGGIRNGKALVQLGQSDAMERDKALTAEELEVKRRVVDEFKIWAMLEEISWRQKSRELWLKEKDKNTIFFHKMANTHRTRNFLEKLRINGDLLVGENNIKEGMARAFQLMFSKMGEWRSSIEGLVFNFMSSTNSAAFELPFSEDELLAKVLANRLKKVVDTLVLDFQNAFVGETNFRCNFDS